LDDAEYQQFVNLGAINVPNSSNSHIKSSDLMWTAIGGCAVGAVLCAIVYGAVRAVLCAIVYGAVRAVLCAIVYGAVRYYKKSKNGKAYSVPGQFTAPATIPALEHPPFVDIELAKTHPPTYQSA
jgi:hypothetical protein